MLVLVTDLLSIEKSSLFLLVNLLLKTRHPAPKPYKHADFYPELANPLLLLIWRHLLPVLLTIETPLCKNLSNVLFLILLVVPKLIVPLHRILVVDGDLGQKCTIH